MIDILCCRFKVGKYSANKSKTTAENLLLTEDTSNGHLSRQSSQYSDRAQTQSYDPVDLLEDLQQRTDMVPPVVRQNSGQLIVGNSELGAR